MLRELDLQPVYNRNNCPDLVGQLFVPLLGSSVRYDRATYTFNARALSNAAAGLAGLIRNGGRMRLICHHKLPRSVVEAILDGQRSAEEAVLESVGRMSLTDVSPHDLEQKHHLDLLTWLVREERLEIRVAIPKQEDALFHRKTGIFTDGNGDSVGFDGSVNESVMGWLNNDESLVLFKSWSHSEFLDPLTGEFERLWHGNADSSMVIPIPEALRRDLIEFAPEENPSNRKDDQDTEAPQNAELPREDLWEAVGHAVTHDPQTTLETIAARLWPHQLSFWRRYARDAEEPPRVLIADEVGLGKTIQAGALLKTFLNRGQADRVLILTPAVARRQWQEELAYKFNINIPMLDRRGANLHLVNSRGDSRVCGPMPWREAPQLILSYDWLRRNADAFFEDRHPKYDIIIFDEAHHARYSEVTNPNRRSPNSYLRMLRKLSDDTNGLLLLSATPMQIDPSELWALLQVLNAEADWSESEFREFYDTSRESTLTEWDWARRLWSRNGLPGTVEQIAELSRMPVDTVERHIQYIQSNNPVTLRNVMTKERISESMTMMRRSSAIKRLVSRHTRNLLRQYAEEGRLSQTVPNRDVEPVAIEMKPSERHIYKEIKPFVRDWYQEQVGMNPQALGFVMTHFRSRLGSSRYAFLRSLEDLRERKRVAWQSSVQWEDILDDDEDVLDFDPESQLPDIALSSRGERALDQLIERCRIRPDSDSKYREFVRQLDTLRRDGYSRVMVFSQFWDTQKWLRDQLTVQQGTRNLVGLSGSEDWIYDPTASGVSVTDRADVMRRFREEPDCVLLCTETAAESLNFQFCSAIINYDIPWNPMKLEQRIGRIDRIGQRKAVIRIVNLFYKDTVEYDAYMAMAERIKSFTENVGSLQPILAANLEKIIREGEVDGSSPDNIREAVNALPSAGGFDLDDLAATASDTDDPDPSLYMNDLTYILSHPEWMPDEYKVEPEGRDHWRVTRHDDQPISVTTVREAHDYAAGSVEFFGPGSEAFPISGEPRHDADDACTSLNSSIQDILLHGSR